MNNNKLFAVLGLFLISIIWGANIPYMKIALNFSGPAEFAFLRNFFGSIILFSILIYLKKPIFIKEAPKLFILGLFQTAGFTGFLTWALLEGIASKTVILVFTMPLWVSMMAWPLLKERRFWVALLFFAFVFLLKNKFFRMFLVIGCPQGQKVGPF